MNTISTISLDALATQPSIADLLKARDEKAAQGSWVAACGGLETPFLSRSGRRLLYCWQPSTGRHAYLDCGTDIILTQEESDLAMGYTIVDGK